MHYNVIRLFLTMKMQAEDNNRKSIISVKRNEEDFQNAGRNCNKGVEVVYRSEHSKIN